MTRLVFRLQSAFVPLYVVLAACGGGSSSDAALVVGGNLGYDGAVLGEVGAVASV